MKDMDARDCTRFEQVLLDEAEGKASARDLEFMAAHRRTCPVCGSELDALDLMRFDGTSGAAEPLDDVARRRWVNRMVDEAEAEPAREHGEGRPRRKSWAVPAMLGAMAAACAAMVAGVTIYVRSKSPKGPKKALVAAAPRGRILLRAGKATVDGAPLAVGQAVGEGQDLAVKKGSAGVRLPMGSVVLLSHGGELAVQRLTRRKVRVRLTRGEMLASVTRRKTGQVFEVSTSHGRFIVKGTIFSVRVAGNAAVLKVFRGAVTARSVDGKVIDVVRGQTVTLGAGAPAPGRKMDGGDVEKAASRIRLLTVLGTDASATMHIRSRPTDATVLMDGTEVGLTPLSAAIRPGHWKLDVKMRGRMPVGEFLELRPGDVVTRDLDLRPALASAGRPAVARPEAVPAVENGIKKSRRRRRAREVPEAPAVEKPKVSPARLLLIKAQKQRTARNFTGAAATYRKLIRKFPRSAEARAALVSLGYVLLGPLKKPAGALALFVRYLKRTRSGVLAREATYGRARALRALGRRTEEITVLKAFLTRYPRAWQADPVRRRLKSLGVSIGSGQNR